MEQIIHRNPAVEVRQEEDGESILLNPDTQNVYVMNKYGLVIWELCQGRSHESVEDEIRKQYAVDDGTAEKITEFLDFLEEKELITLSDNGNNQA